MKVSIENANSESKRSIWLGSALANALILITGVFTGVLLARVLAPEGRGALASIIFWPQIIASVGFLSLNDAVIYSICKKNNDIGKVVGATIIISTVLVVITESAGYLLLPVIGTFGGNKYLMLSKIYLSIYIPISFLTGAFIAIEQGKQKFLNYNIQRLVMPLGSALGLVVLWQIGVVSIENVIIINLISGFLLLMAQVRILSGWTIDWSGGLHILELLRAGVKMHFATMVVIFGTQIDKYVVIKELNVRDVGIYAVAFTFASAGIGVLSTTYNTVMFPQLASLPTKDQQTREMISSVKKAMFMLSIGVLLLYHAVDVFVPWLYGQEFSSGSGATKILIVACSFLTLRQILARSLQAMGDSTATVKVELINGVFICGAAWLFSSQLDVERIAIIVLGSNIAALAFLTYYVRTKFKTPTFFWWGVDRNTACEVWGAFKRVIVKKYGQDIG